MEELGRKSGVAVALGGLGDVARSLGDYPAARGYYERALRIFEETGSPFAKDIKERIEKLDETIKRSKNESEA